MRRLCLCLALSLLAGPASGQEKYDFKPQAKAGDVFLSSLQRSEKLDFRPEGLLSGSHTRSIELERRILEAKDGTPVRFEDRTTKHEDRMTGTLATLPLDETTRNLQGVAIRYERVGSEYEAMLIEGELNPDVAEALKRSNAYPLDENFLPTKPLAVGESQVLLDQKRLTWALKEEGPPAKYEEEPTLTLEKVATVDGVKTAFLKLTVRSVAEDPDTPGRKETFQGKATILYNLDQQYVTRVEMRGSIQGSGEINGKKGTLTADLVIVSRTRKK